MSKCTESQKPEICQQSDSENTRQVLKDGLVVENIITQKATVLRSTHASGGYLGFLESCELKFQS